MALPIDLVVKIIGSTQAHPGELDVVASKNLKDVFLFRLGAEYASSHDLHASVWQGGSEGLKAGSDPTQKIVAQILNDSASRIFLFGNSIGGQNCARVSKQINKNGRKQANFIGLSDPAFDSEAWKTPDTHEATEMFADDIWLIFQSITEYLRFLIPGVEFHGPVHRPNVRNEDVSLPANPKYAKLGFLEKWNQAVDLHDHPFHFGRRSKALGFSDQAHDETGPEGMAMIQAKIIELLKT